MARRRDGRELFEIFRESKASQGPVAPQEAPSASRERVTGSSSPSMHTLRLGDRRQVEVFLSLGWVYGIAFCVFLALVGSFVLGRRSAPEAEPITTVDAPDSFAGETEAVTYARAEQPEARPEPQRTPPSEAAPAPVAGPGLYTLRVSTYLNVAAQRERAEEFVEWLHEQGYREARIVTSRNGRNLYVTIGSFETTRSDEAVRLQREVRALRYKNETFSDAFFQNVNTL